MGEACDICKPQENDDKEYEFIRILEYGKKPKGNVVGIIVTYNVNSIFIALTQEK